MKRLSLLVVVFLFREVYAFSYRDQYGLNITYDVKFRSKCRTDEDRFRRILGIELPVCVRECALRPQCEALSYRRQIQVCDLFTTPDAESLGRGECISIPASDIKVEQKPCGQCSYGKVCDRHSKNCTFKECTSANITNGVVLGNRNEVHSRINYKCNHGYRNRNGKETVVCQGNGTWNATADCARVCQVLPSINNGSVALDKMNGNTYMDTATITCDYGYQSNVDTINCTETGDWDNATCDPVVCQVLPSINNGSVALDKMNGNTYMDTATITCDYGYQSSVDTINCTETGDWDNATCDPVACGSPQPIDYGNISLNSGTKYLDTAAVTCNTKFLANTSTIVCTGSGIWENATCIPHDCYINHVWEYYSTKNVTVSGYACERWDGHIGKYGINAQYVPESSLSGAANYCRNPTSNSHWPLWCFSSRPDEEWETCDITPC